ncbi:hypothetical protein ACIBL8_07550 [Streptomyces sp. NPDC050523]|uniref:hypothetical protein n=1 Tax=Streptomyces sp. NPDC050523 TaxID=3365622 RepID=UPI0037B1B303
MHHSRRASPVTNRTCSIPVVTAAVLALLALLAALCVSGPAGTTSRQAINSTTPKDSYQDSGPRADDGCGAACTVSAATRHTPHGEHLAPRNHLAAGPDDSTAITPPRPAAHPATTRRVPSPEPPPTPDRDRAPPPSSGI